MSRIEYRLGQVKFRPNHNPTQPNGDDQKLLLPKPEISGRIGFLVAELDLGPSLSVCLSPFFFFNKQFFLIKIQFYEDKLFIMFYFILEYS